MKWELVHTVHGYYDAPRFGIADLNGVPHIYESPFDDETDDYSDIYKLSPIDSELMALVMKDWVLWEKWESAFYNGLAVRESHSCLPEDRNEHERLMERIGDRFKINESNCIFRKAEFRAVSKRPRRLLVKWAEYGV